MKKETHVIAMPVAADQVHLSEHFGEAPYFLLLSLKRANGALMEESWLSDPFQTVAKGKGIKVSEWLVSLGIDEVVTLKSFAHKGPHYVFSDNGVEVRQTEESNLNELKESLIKSPEAGSRSNDTTVG